MVKQLFFAHSIPGHSRPMGRPHLTWMDTAMHDMGCLGHTLQVDLPRDWANLALYRDVWRGVVSRWLSCEQCLFQFFFFFFFFFFYLSFLRFMLGA